MYFLCEAFVSKKKAGFGRIVEYMYPESKIWFALFTIVYWKPEMSHLVHTPWDHKPLNGSIFATS